jgi:hypothetical protein
MTVPNWPLVCHSASQLRARKHRNIKHVKWHRRQHIGETWLTQSLVSDDKIGIDHQKRKVDLQRVNHQFETDVRARIDCRYKHFIHPQRSITTNKKATVETTIETTKSIKKRPKEWKIQISWERYLVCSTISFGVWINHSYKKEATKGKSLKKKAENPLAYPKRVARMGSTCHFGCFFV